MLGKYVVRNTTKIYIKINYCFTLVKLKALYCICKNGLQMHLHAVDKILN